MRRGMERARDRENRGICIGVRDSGIERHRRIKGFRYRRIEGDREGN
jgi:hypothetical protein